MFRDLIIGINEGLFWLLGGEMLINTPWIFVWVALGVSIISAPIIIHTLYFIHKVWVMFLTAPFLGLLFMIIISPGAIQMQLMQECRTFEKEIAGELSETILMTLKECRYKENYYEDFGEWKLIGL